MFIMLFANGYKIVIFKTDLFILSDLYFRGKLTKF